MRGGRAPVHDDKVLLGGDVHHLGPQIRRRLTSLSDDLFQPLHPRVLRMQGRMIMEVISEVLMHNIEVAPHTVKSRVPCQAIPTAPRRTDEAALGGSTVASRTIALL